MSLLWLGVASLVWLLLVGVSVIGDGFLWISGGTEGAEEIFAFASNPLAGVTLGVLATAVVQSSSTVTSVIVALVAGGVPVSIAIPIVMGANVGSTLTNTIVSMGNLGDGPAFNKSFQAATVHDFFNLCAIAILLPLEVLFHPLERMAGAAAGLFAGDGSASSRGLNVVGAVTKPAGEFIVGLFESLPDTVGALAAIAAGIGMIVVSVIYLGKLLRGLMSGRGENVLAKSIGRGPLVGIGSGALVTLIVQSSSATTSLLVPLAGAGAITTRQVFHFTMGANIGTSITALLAATAVSGGYELFALQIALVHLLYNSSAVILFLAIPWLGDRPVLSAEWLGNKTQENRGWAFAYIACLFFVLPGAVFAGQVLLDNTEEHIVAAEAQEALMDDVELDVLQEEMAIE